MLTVLHPGISESVDSFRLVLSNDHIAYRAARQQIEDRICVGTLGLFVAAALDSFVSLHLSIENLSWLNVHGLVEHNSLFRNGEF